jgi:hypothetical protein
MLLIDNYFNGKSARDRRIEPIGRRELFRTALITANEQAIASTSSRSKRSLG